MRTEAGFTLIETIVFMVVLSIGLVALSKVFMHSLKHSVDPVTQILALQKGQAMLDDILVHNFDERTPLAKTPACGEKGMPACAGVTQRTQLNDVGDYHGYSEKRSGYQTSVTVTDAGSDLGLISHQAKLVTVTVAMPDGREVHLSAYRVNF